MIADAYQTRAGALPIALGPRDVDRTRRLGVSFATMQRGSIRRYHGARFAKYWETVLDSRGAPVKRRVSKRLPLANEGFPDKRSVLLPEMQFLLDKSLPQAH
jgi:hypothetical protein